jgi:hypothetical protein
MTRNDILNHNADLIAKACGILAGMPNQSLAATCSRRADGSIDVGLTTKNVTRVDVSLNSRPLQSVNSSDGAMSFSLAIPVQAPPPGPGANMFEFRGFREGKLVASKRVTL